MKKAARGRKIDFLMKIEKIFENFGENGIEKLFADFKKKFESVWDDRDTPANPVSEENRVYPAVLN